jgi:hypothetical protein
VNTARGIKMTIPLVAMALCFVLVPASASADYLRMGPFRAFVQQKALEDYLRSPDATSYSIDRCSRVNDHKLKCDANIYGDTLGGLSCNSSGCRQEITAFICWRTFTRTVTPHWKPLRITNRSSRSTCRYESRVEVY